MILAKIQDAPRYYALHPLLHEFFQYVGSHDLTALAPGRIELEGKNLFINIDCPTLRPQATQQLEQHRQYIDIHLPLDRTERIGITPEDELPQQPLAPYDAAKDIAFFAPPARTYFDVHPGWFCIVFPEDAHAPIIGEGTLHKAVGKIRILPPFLRPLPPSAPARSTPLREKD